MRQLNVFVSCQVCFRFTICRCLLENKVKRSQTIAMTIKYIYMDVLFLTRRLKAFTRDALVDILMSSTLNGYLSVSSTLVYWFKSMAGTQCLSLQVHLEVCDVFNSRSPESNESKALASYKRVMMI